ncbi:MAG TPA: DUF494 family protein [Candidatus Limnocylindria bacterium]|nr:DUF494 family protein [Candidatus Limnocylindria bacterium]
MSEPRDDGSVQRLLRRLADHLEEYLEGDERALEALAEALEDGGFSGEDLQSAILAVRSLAGDPRFGAVVTVDDPPGASAHRVLSAEERESVSPEAWGYLLDLKERGSLDADQFERVLDRLTMSGVRPVGIDLAREVAAQIALRAGDPWSTYELPHGERDLAN